ncbi:MAG TPA: non-canonical purine NTP pyrophosphatase, partial [Polyangiales bacterium]|nr:non-canonical purine NTP pyrophosphatase [Polyangiales bacterium]
MLLLIATRNAGKAREFATLFADLPGISEVRTLADYPQLPDVVEDGATFEANAQKKAVEIARVTGCLVLADD